MTKTALITGASTGFGRRTAETLFANGIRVFASMRDTAVKNKEHADALIAQGINVIELDVTDGQSIEAAIATILEQAGGIDILVNNAGIAAAGVSEAFTDKQVTDLFDVNVVGLHRVSQAVLPIMRRQGAGLVVNVGSILGRVTFPFFGIYGASKFAVEALTDSYRYEVSQFGVDVALIQPSAYPTQMYGSSIQPADLARIADYGDVGRIPEAMFESFMAMFEGEDAPNPQDVAQAIDVLVKTPAGQRPQRVVVGNSFGADVANNAIEPLQAQAVAALGLDHLEQLKIA